MSEKLDEEVFFDFTKGKRGETPENIEQKCFRLCKEYLGGVWLNLDFDDVKIERLSGGLTNQFYHCIINENKQVINAKEPQEVGIRMYGPKHFISGGEEKDQRLTDRIISLMLSERGLSPKVYGIFEEGEIIKFYKHKTFGIEQQKEPKLVEEVAQKLARVHALDVPIRKRADNNWVFDHYDRCLRLSKERFDLKTLFEETNCETLIKYDLDEEKEWLKSAITDIDSPFVMNLTDFSPVNIMATETDGIVFCDFDYSCYCYRGHDFGTLFGQWGYVLGQPYEFPDDSIIKPFIDSYIKEMLEIKGQKYVDKKRISFEYISKEAKVFGLNLFLAVTLFFLQMEESLALDAPFDKKKSMTFVEMNYKTYQKYKQKFIDEGVVQKQYKTR